MTTLVIGGTGNVGREVVPRLLARGHAVTVLIRDPRDAPAVPAPARAIGGNLEDPTSLAPAFHRAERVFLLVAQSPSEAAQGLHAVAAARAAGIGRLVYVSVAMPPFAPEVPHFATKMRIEQAVREADIPFTILRPNNFFQNDAYFRAAILDGGVYPQPIGAAGLARVDVRDIADAAAVTLTEPGHDGRTYALNGPDVLTGDAVAATYSRHLGRPVRYAGDSLESWAAAASGTLPPWLVADLRVMYDRFQRYGMVGSAADHERQRRLLGRPARPFDTYAAELVRSWRGRPVGAGTGP